MDIEFKGLSGTPNAVNPYRVHAVRARNCEVGRFLRPVHSETAVDGHASDNVKGLLLLGDGTLCVNTDSAVSPAYGFTWQNRGYWLMDYNLWRDCENNEYSVPDQPEIILAEVDSQPSYSVSGENWQVMPEFGHPTQELSGLNALRDNNWNFESTGDPPSGWTRTTGGAGINLTWASPASPHPALGKVIQTQTHSDNTRAVLQAASMSGPAGRKLTVGIQYALLPDASVVGGGTFPDDATMTVVLTHTVNGVILTKTFTGAAHFPLPGTMAETKLLHAACGTGTCSNNGTVTLTISTNILGLIVDNVHVLIDAVPTVSEANEIIEHLWTMVPPQTTKQFTHFYNLGALEDWSLYQSVRVPAITIEGAAFAGDNIVSLLLESGGKVTSCPLINFGSREFSTRVGSDGQAYPVVKYADAEFDISRATRAQVRSLGFAWYAHAAFNYGSSQRWKFAVGGAQVSPSNPYPAWFPQRGTLRGEQVYIATAVRTVNGMTLESQASLPFRYVQPVGTYGSVKVTVHTHESGAAPEKVYLYRASGGSYYRVGWQNVDAPYLDTDVIVTDTGTLGASFLPSGRLPYGPAVLWGNRIVVAGATTSGADERLYISTVGEPFRFPITPSDVSQDGWTLPIAGKPITLDIVDSGSVMVHTAFGVQRLAGHSYSQHVFQMTPDVAALAHGSVRRGHVAHRDALYVNNKPVFWLANELDWDQPVLVLADERCAAIANKKTIWMMHSKFGHWIEVTLDDENVTVIRDMVWDGQNLLVGTNRGVWRVMDESAPRKESALWSSNQFEFAPQQRLLWLNLWLGGTGGVTLRYLTEHGTREATFSESDRWFVSPPGGQVSRWGQIQVEFTNGTQRVDVMKLTMEHDTGGLQ